MTTTMIFRPAVLPVIRIITKMRWLMTLVVVVGALVSCSNPDYEALLPGTWRIAKLQLKEVPPDGDVEMMERLAQEESIFQFKEDKSYALKLGNGYVSGRWQINRDSSPVRLQLFNEAGSLSEMSIQSLSAKRLVLVSPFRYGRFRTSMVQELVPTKDTQLSIPTKPTQIKGSCDSTLTTNLHSIACYTEYQAAWACAQQSRRPLLLLFTSDGDETCTKLEQMQFSENLNSMIEEGFVLVRMESSQAKAAALLNDWQMSQLPTYTVLDMREEVVSHFHWSEEKTESEFRVFLLRALNSI